MVALASRSIKDKKLTPLGKARERTAYKFIAIPVLYFVITRALPTIFSFVLSFMKWDLLSPQKSFVPENPPQLRGGFFCAGFS